MANWSDIPQDIVRKVAVEHVENLEDFENIGEVCSAWRFATKGVKFCPSTNTQLPWLMLVDPPNSPHRRFYSLFKHMFRKIDLPQHDYDNGDDDHRRYFSSKGWLISVSRRNRNITLFNPVSGKVIKAPSVPPELVRDGDDWNDLSYEIHFCKFVVSSYDDDDCTVAMMFDITQQLAFWRPGEHKWTKPVVDFKIHWVLDTCFYKGEFYAIDYLGKVMAFGSEMAKRQPRIVVDLIGQGLVAEQTDKKFYLVGVESTLFAIHKDVYLADDEEVEEKKIEIKYWTTNFEIFELNVESGKAKAVEGVGNRAIFTGLNSTFSVEASSTSGKPGCKPNCIYFTDDNDECSHSGDNCTYGSDMGVYSLAQGKVIERYYEGPSRFCFITPPIWVERPHS